MDEKIRRIAAEAMNGYDEINDEDRVFILEAIVDDGGPKLHRLPMIMPTDKHVVPLVVSQAKGHVQRIFPGGTIAAGILLLDSWTYPQRVYDDLNERDFADPDVINDYLRNKYGPPSACPDRVNLTVCFIQTADEAPLMIQRTRGEPSTEISSEGMSVDGSMAEVLYGLFR